VATDRQQVFRIAGTITGVTVRGGTMHGRVDCTSTVGMSGASLSHDVEPFDDVYYSTVTTAPARETL